MELEQFGWNIFFASQLTTSPAGIPGRVASANHGRFLVWTEAGEVDRQRSGALRKAGAALARCGRLGHAAQRCRGHRQRVLDRKTKLSRKQPEREIREQVLAANIDVLFIVSGLDRDYNPRRIERFLVMAKESGARPVVLLNKADLAAELGLDLAESLPRASGTEPGNHRAADQRDVRSRP